MDRPQENSVFISAGAVPWPPPPPPHILPPRSRPAPPPRHVVHLSLDNVRLPIQRPADDKLFSRTGGEYTGNDDYGDSLVLQDSTEIRPCRFANSEACMMRLLSFFSPPPPSPSFLSSWNYRLFFGSQPLHTARMSFFPSFSFLSFSCFFFLSLLVYIFVS